MPSPQWSASLQFEAHSQSSTFPSSQVSPGSTTPLPQVSPPSPMAIGAPLVPPSPPPSISGGETPAPLPAAASAFEPSSAVLDEQPKASTSESTVIPQTLSLTLAISASPSKRRPISSTKLSVAGEGNDHRGRTK